MAITFNTLSKATSGTTTTSVTFSHTSDGNHLIVRVNLRGSPSNVSVTYNSISVPLVIEKLGSFVYTAIFHLATPASGANNVVVSWTGSCSYEVNAVNYSGAGDPTNSISASGTSAAPSVTVTSASGNLVIDSCVFFSIATLTVGAGQTQQVNENSGGANPVTGAGSYESGASSVTMSWSASGSDFWAIVGVDLPALSASTSNFLFFM